MATIITNRATVNYSYGASNSVSVSNTASTVLNGALNVSKTALNGSYRVGSEITYIVTVRNDGTGIMTDVTVTDDLGALVLGGSTVRTLDYIGPAQLYVGGNLVAALTPTTTADGISFNIGTLNVGAVANIIYVTRVNRYASGAVGDSITNTVNATSVCDCPCNYPASATSTVPAESYGDLQVLKSACPGTIACGNELTYTIDLYNYGNMEVENVVLSDTLDPVLADLIVKVNGTLIPSGQYDYTAGVLTLPNATGSEITVPAATYIRNAESGIVSVDPGHVQIVLSGTIAV